MNVMKRIPIFYTVIAMLLCSVVSTSSFWGDRCSAQITIYNKLPSDVTVAVNGQTKKIPPWGNCTEKLDDGSEQIIPCSKDWSVNWDTSFAFFPTFCESWNELDDDEDFVMDSEEDDEEEGVCKTYDVYISVEGADELSRSLGLSDYEHEILVINEHGLWKVKNPYLDHPEHLRNVYEWFEDAELHQP